MIRHSFKDELLKFAAFGEGPKNLWYLLKHKYHVLSAGNELGLPVLQSLGHDLSKVRPSEWEPYKRFFFGEPTEEDKQEFREAVKLHYSRNPHHVENYEDPSIMPIGRRLEMVADWYGSARAQGENWDSLQDWWKAKRDDPAAGDKLDEETKKLVDKLVL